MGYLDVPLAFRGVAWLQNTRRGTHQWVTPASDILTEGYPRSGNTFLYRIIRASTLQPIKIGHHVHRPQQITFAVRYGVPSFVLLRDPLASIASHLVYNPHLTPAISLDRYIRFYEAAARYTEQDGVHIIVFDQLIKNPIRAVRALLDQADIPYFVDEEVVARATEDTRADRARQSLPDAYKESLKEKHYAAIRNSPGFARGTELFHSLKGRSWRF